MCHLNKQHLTSDSSSSGSQETKHLEEAVKAGHGDAQQPQLLFRSPSLCLLQWKSSRLTDTQPFPWTFYSLQESCPWSSRLWLVRVCFSVLTPTCYFLCHLTSYFFSRKHLSSEHISLLQLSQFTSRTHPAQLTPRPGLQAQHAALHQGGPAEVDQ